MSWTGNFLGSIKRGLLDKKSLYLLGSIWFLNWLFLFFDVYLWAFEWPWIFMILLSPLLGMAGIYIITFFLHGIGKLLFKGKASFSQVLTVYSRSQMPLLINVGMWLLLFLFGIRGFLLLRYSGIIPFIFVNLIILISLCWSLILLFCGLREVEEFSFIKTFFSILLILPVYLFVIFLYNFISVFVFAVILLS
jgi:hypothetical protein